MKFFSFSAFIISFLVGVLIIYFTDEHTRDIMVYPTPENVDELLYKDKVDSCFNFKPQLVDCPTDQSHIEQIQPQV
jgi:hypothetical protein